ncbi:hypothetical protein ANO11243_001120 [Dothideomycetidae sp. 11243]|nr:hypothetical protein ANO11243_001120 [fungal sp. No.11243]
MDKFLFLPRTSSVYSREVDYEEKTPTVLSVDHRRRRHQVVGTPAFPAGEAATSPSDEDYIVPTIDNHKDHSKLVGHATFSATSHGSKPFQVLDSKPTTEKSRGKMVARDEEHIGHHSFSANSGSKYRQKFRSRLVARLMSAAEPDPISNFPEALHSKQSRGKMVALAPVDAFDDDGEWTLCGSPESSSDDDFPSHLTPEQELTQMYHAIYESLDDLHANRWSILPGPPDVKHESNLTTKALSFNPSNGSENQVRDGETTAEAQAILARDLSTIQSTSYYKTPKPVENAETYSPMPKTPESKRRNSSDSDTTVTPQAVEGANSYSPGTAYVMATVDALRESAAAKSAYAETLPQKYREQMANWPQVIRLPPNPFMDDDESPIEGTYRSHFGVTNATSTNSGHTSNYVSERGTQTFPRGEDWFGYEPFPTGVGHHSSANVMGATPRSEVWTSYPNPAFDKDAPITPSYYATCYSDAVPSRSRLNSNASSMARNATYSTLSAIKDLISVMSPKSGKEKVTTPEKEKDKRSAEDLIDKLVDLASKASPSAILDKIEKKRQEALDLKREELKRSIRINRD